jgi:hypothetical protein
MSSWLATMILVCIGWILFRAHTFGDAVTVLTNLFAVSGYSDAHFSTLFGYAIPLIVVEVFQRASGKLEFLTLGPFLLRYTMCVVLVLTLFAFSARGSHEFIYFDF